MDTRHQRRAAVNAAAIREANEEQVRAMEQFRGSRLDELEIMCECSVSECEDAITLSREQYAEVRSDPRWFAVLPDHVIPATETTMRRLPGHWIVQKLGSGAEVAVEDAAESSCTTS